MQLSRRGNDLAGRRELTRIGRPPARKRPLDNGGSTPAIEIAALRLPNLWSNAPCQPSSLGICFRRSLKIALCVFTTYRVMAAGYAFHVGLFHSLLLAGFDRRFRRLF
jgi:hypothetical protein